MLFSSVGSALGNVGQASYASANGWLDALSANRRSVPACRLRAPVANDWRCRHGSGGRFMARGAPDDDGRHGGRLSGAVCSLPPSPHGAVTSACRWSRAGCKHAPSVRPCALLSDLSDANQARFGELAALVKHSSYNGGNGVSCASPVAVETPVGRQCAALPSTMRWCSRRLRSGMR